VRGRKEGSVDISKAVICVCAMALLRCNLDVGYFTVCATLLQPQHAASSSLRLMQVDT
jgi:hypothetical protein